MKQGADQKIKSGYDKWKRNVSTCCLNIVSDGADVMCDGRLLQRLAPETKKACLVVIEVMAFINGNILVVFMLLYARPRIDIIQRDNTQWQHTEAKARLQHTNPIQWWIYSLLTHTALCCLILCVLISPVSAYCGLILFNYFIIFVSAVVVLFGLPAEIPAATIPKSSF